MTDNEVQNDQNYTYKDKTYRVSECNGLLVKDCNDSNWYPAVQYFSMETGDDPDLRFVRRLDDFQTKFKPA